MRDETLQSAARQGYDTGVSGSWGWASPCPLCGAERQHPSRNDPRGAVAVAPSGYAFCMCCRRRVRLGGPEGALPARPVSSVYGLDYPTLSVLAGFYAEHRDRTIYPLYDTEGVERSAVVRLRPGSRIKSMSPPGYSRGGLCFVGADLLEYLRTRETPLRSVLTILEGESDWDAYCRQKDTFCLGIVSGSWTDEWAAAIPYGVRVLIATDLDAAGERYAKYIVRSLENRLRHGTLQVSRWSPPEEFRDSGGTDVREYLSWTAEREAD
ncbi:MAG: hypothetical protein GWN58_58570 [Anaerolineae bacterium]|nr:hypothetical protein [Anaerolineae bacterium]